MARSKGIVPTDPVMPRVPSSIFFLCESCERSAKPRQIRRWLGQCRRCTDGRSWTMLVNYEETESNVLLNLFTLVFGGWYTRKHFHSQTTASGISRDVAQYLTETRSLVYPRAEEYIRDRNREDLIQTGAKTCKFCDAVYVPSDDKPWTEQGYCSRSCAADDGVDTFADFNEPTSIPKRSPTISVVCPNGHHFEVLVTFSGCLRPCADCGAKTLVP